MILGHIIELTVLTTKFLVCNCKKICSELYKEIINLDKRTESLSYKRKHLNWLQYKIFLSPPNELTTSITIWRPQPFGTA